MWAECTCCRKCKPLWCFTKGKLTKTLLSGCCKVCDNKRSRKWMADNKERRSKYIKKHYRENLDKYKKWGEGWTSNNRERSNAIKAKYKKANPTKNAVLEAKRRALRFIQTPDLSDDEINKINVLYEVSNSLGPDYQVDHVVPLSKGGLHHHSNLQVISITENLKKNNKIDYIVKGLKIYWKDDILIKEENAKVFS